MIHIKFSALLGERLIKTSTIAKATGISRTTLTNLYYRRSVGITLDVLDKLCRYLDCSVSDILEYRDDKEDTPCQNTSSTPSRVNLT